MQMASAAPSSTSSRSYFPTARSVPARSSSLSRRSPTIMRNYASAARCGATNWKPGRPQPGRPACGWVCATTCSAATRGPSKRSRVGDGGALAHFYLGKAHFALRAIRRSHHELTTPPRKAGYNNDDCALGHGRGAALLGRRQGRAGHARQALGRRRADGRIPVSARRDGRGHGRQPDEVVALFERAVEADRKHRRRAVRPGAWKTTAAATTTTALDLYQRSAVAVSGPRRLAAEPGHAVRRPSAVRPGSAVLPADSGRSIPIIARARLFLKDAAASGDMFYDEEAQRRRDRLAQVLNMPVTDFELSVRSRNCLQKMGIMHARRPDPHDGAGAAGQQELRRNVAGRNSRHAHLEGAWRWVSSRTRSAEPEPAFEPDSHVARRAGACSIGRSPI